MAAVLAFGFSALWFAVFADSADALSCEGELVSTFGDGAHGTSCILNEGVYVAEDVEDVCRVTITELDGTTRSLAWVGRAVLEIDHGWANSPGMTGIESEGCGTWQPRDDDAMNPMLSEFGSGAYEVGRDIEPGVYESSAFSARCFWFYIQDWTYRDTLSTKVVVWQVGQPVVEIPDDAIGFYSARCGNWSLRATVAPGTPYTSFADGSFIAGADIAPGRYVSDGPVDDGECVWYRTSPVGSGADGAGIGGHSSRGRQVVEVSSDDVGFYSAGCGEWSLFAEEDGADSRWAEFAEGTYVVGTDIAVDTYVAESVGGRLCEWVVLSGFGGTGSDISRSGVGRLRGIVKILANDVGFRSTGCETWRALDSLDLGRPPATFPDGEYAVGVHVDPGLYVSDGAPVGRCFWRRLSDFTWDDSEVLGIRNQVGRVVVRIMESDAGFESLGCGTWRYQPLHGTLHLPSTSFDSGTWLVGFEVRPGLYSASLGAGDICFWGRYSDLTGSPADLLAAGVAENNALVMLEEDDLGVYSDGCGTWVLASALPDKMPVEWFNDGVHLVGSEIAPGTYETVSQIDRTCVWSRLSGFRGTDIERIATISSDGASLVTILESDAGFRSWGCETWEPLEEPGAAVSLAAAPFNDGMHLVGRDVAPGVYRATEHVSTRCRWVRLSDWSWTVGVITERVQRDVAVAEIAASDAGFFSEGCGEWVPVDVAVTGDAAPTAEFGDGAHRVGEDIAVGVYRSDQQFQVGECRWARLSDFGGTQSGRVATGGSEDGDWIVEVRAGDAGFESSGCGRWHLVEESEQGVTLSTAGELGDGVYRVGLEVVPGVYESNIGTDRYQDGQFVPACRWSRLSGFGHESADVTEAGAGWGIQRVEVTARDEGFVSTGCGGWRLVE